MSNPPPTDAFLASLVNASGDAILSTDPDGRITSWNRAAERIFGHAAAEAVGRPLAVLFPPERPHEEAGLLARVARGEEIRSHETMLRRSDGRPVEVSLALSPVRDPRGGIVGACLIARDISAERREQERLGVTLSSIGDAVIATDERGRVVFMNAVAEHLTGWAHAEANGRPLLEIFPIVNETTRLAVRSPVDRVLEEGVTVGLANHTILIARDGVERPIDDSAAPIRDRSGALVGVVLVFRDVTERRAAELAALRLAAIVEGSDDAIVSKNLNSVVQSWNPGAERIFGYTAEEMIGRPITVVIPPERIDEEQQILARLQRGERVEHFTTVRVRKNGERFPVSLTISPIRDDEGHIIGASKIARDITDLQKFQEQLRGHAEELETRVRERTAKLETVVSELEAFSYSLSHDMRAPVRAIHSFSEIVLADHGDRIGEGGEYLRKIVAAAARLDRMIQDVLSFARLSRAEIPMAPVDLDKLVRDLLEDRPEFHTPPGTVRIRGRLAPVLGHDASLTQCLTNLIANAVKFVAPGVEPKVFVSTRELGDRVRICVTDNGIGISPANQRRLFAIFERLETGARFEGTGLGLAIVRKAVERMKGEVSVDSVEGAGSTFWIELPRA